jgi:type II secretory ATPase GspE/PulE/Tfp pilus assembly ATPase PilB-like protein
MMSMGVRNIGMLDEVLEEYLKAAQRPNGIILVTGPTGCGKTTTLYATLAEVLDPGMKFITTEDPVEYELAGVQQVNINEGVGLTYARSLRAILRQDPDVVLVGEIRDVETAQITVQASLTGHLVFSTLHTNSAAATVTRLLDMGVEPFLITSSLEAIIGQRLVRTICAHCKTPYKPGEEELDGFGITQREVDEQGAVFYPGAGCPDCGHMGYRGRLGIYELMRVDDELRDLILERATTDELMEAALRNGMISMRQDGWRKVCMGITTLSEIARQTPRESEMGPATESDDAAESREALEGKGRPELEGAGAGQKALPKPQPQLTKPGTNIEGEEAAPVA